MTLNDFIMESAIVETTNDTAVSDIQMEQWNAEINVASAMFDVMSKYTTIAEYATCDVDEFFEESKYGPSMTAKLTGKISKVEDWKKDGGVVKKVLGTIALGVLKMIRAIARFFKKIFKSEKNPFRKAAKWLKEKKSNRAAKKAEKKAEKGLSEKEIEKLNNDVDYQVEGTKKRYEAKLNAASTVAVGALGVAVQQEAQMKKIIASARDYKEKFNETNIALIKTREALAAAQKALDSATSEKNRLQSNLIDKGNELNQAEDHLRKALATQNKKQRAATDKAISAFLDRNEPTMDDVQAVEAAAKASEETADNLEKVQIQMDDLYATINKAEGSNSEAEKAVKDIIVTAKEVAQDGQKLANEVTGSKVKLPSAQGDEILNQYAI